MQFIDLHRQYDRIEEKIQHGLKDVLEHKKFILGPEVRELEIKLGKYVGVEHVIACASGTDALVLALMAYGLKKNDAIFVPSFSFFASAESISLAGGTPVFVDCRENTFNMSPESLQCAINEVKKKGNLRPRGIIAVDLFGLPAEYDIIKKIAVENDLFLIEDGAQGFGGMIGGKKSCSFGDIATTSFFPAKPLGCYGDGGAVFTDNDELAKKIESIHIHGQGVNKYDNVRLGLNSRLDTIQAVVLNSKLDIFEEEIISRNCIAKAYMNQISENLEKPFIPEGYRSSWAQFTLKAQSSSDREVIMSKLKEENIPIAIYYPIPIHQATAYKEYVGKQILLSTTEDICNRVFSIPMHPYLKKEEIDKICDVINRACKGLN